MGPRSGCSTSRRRPEVGRGPAQRWAGVLGFFGIVLVGSAAHAGDWTPPSCLGRIADEWQLPSRLMQAIVLVESGGDPHALNVNEHGRGKRVSVSSRREAKARIGTLLRQGTNFDIGLGQINSRTAARYGVHPVWLLDPCWNLYVTARHLREKIARYGYGWTAIERYNGINAAYPWKVYEQLRRLSEETEGR